MTAEIAMIEQVEKHRCLYDYGMPEYNRKDITEEAWDQVAAALNCSVNECKDKWKNIRSSYVRSLKKSKRSYYLAAYLQFLVPYIKKAKTIETVQINFDDVDDAGEDENDESEKSDSNERSVCVKQEPLHDPISDAEMYNDDDEVPSPPSPIAKRQKKIIPRQFIPPKIKHFTSKVGGTKSGNVFKHNVENRRKNPRLSESRAMRLFLLSLLPEFETMDGEQVRIFKIKVMMLINEIKGDQDEARQSLRSSSDCQRLQKRLINLLLKNLEQQS